MYGGVSLPTYSPSSEYLERVCSAGLVVAAWSFSLCRPRRVFRYHPTTNAPSWRAETHLAALTADDEPILRWRARHTVLDGYGRYG